MALKSYQTLINLGTLYKVRLKGGVSGLGESLSPRVMSVGGTITIYAAEEEPVGLTLANIATKMALVKADVAVESFTSLPTYLAFIGTSNELVLTSLEIESALVLS